MMQEIIRRQGKENRNRKEDNQKRNPDGVRKPQGRDDLEKLKGTKSPEVNGTKWDKERRASNKDRKSREQKHKVKTKGRA